MATAKTKTLLPLDRFAQIIGFHPVHFNGVYITDIAPATVCDQPVMQYSWQNTDGVGREEIAQAILDAENILAQNLGFNVLPKWEVDDRVIVSKSRVPSQFINPNGLNKSMRASKGYVITGGIETTTLVSAARPIVYTDADTDGYKELATVTCPVSFTDPEEVAIFYPGSTTREIRLTNVSITAGTATITFARHQAILESIIESLAIGARGVSGTDDLNFLTTVDVYRHYNDPQQQLQFVWEPSASVCGGCAGGCSGCTYTLQSGCMNVRDYRLGYFAARPAEWNSTTAAFDNADWAVSREPDRVRMWYKAGWRDMGLSKPNITMDYQWELAVARLALTKLDRRICACETLEAQQRYWREDLAFRFSDRSTSQSYNVSKSLLDNPIGTTRGALFAWQLVRDAMLGDATLGM